MKTPRRALRLTDREIDEAEVAETGAPEPVVPPKSSIEFRVVGNDAVWWLQMRRRVPLLWFWERWTMWEAISFSYSQPSHGWLASNYSNREAAVRDAARLRAYYQPMRIVRI